MMNNLFGKYNSLWVVLEFCHLRIHAKTEGKPTPSCYLSLSSVFQDKKLKFLYFMCMDILFAWLSVHHLFAWCFQRPGGCIESPRTRVMDGCELLGGY